MKPISDALAAVIRCQQQVNELLKSPQHNQIKLNANGQFELLKKKLGFSIAILEPSEVKQVEEKRFKNMTHVGGIPIAGNRVEQSEYLPSDEELDQLRQKAKQLYDSFLTLKPENILRSYTTVEDQKTLRTVAKWAGIEDFKEKALTVPFMEEIAEAIKAKSSKEANQKKFNKDLQETTAKGK